MRSHAEYCAAVETAREYILAGDIFQVVLAQRFDLDSVTAADACPQRDASSDNDLDARSLEEAEGFRRANRGASWALAKANI